MVATLLAWPGQEGIRDLFQSPDLSVPITVGAMTIALSLVSVLHNIFHTRALQHMARRQSALDLYDEFYSIDAYSRIVAPVFEIMIKYQNLPDPARSQLRKTIADGWVGFYAQGENDWVVALTSGDQAVAHPARVSASHFFDKHDSTALTEHEALTAFLSFWVKLDRLVTLKVVEPALVRKLFKTSFRYYQEFLHDMRDDIRDRLGNSDTPPVWLDVVGRLDDFFCVDDTLKPPRLKLT